MYATAVGQPYSDTYDISKLRGAYGFAPGMGKWDHYQWRTERLEVGARTCMYSVLPCVCVGYPGLLKSVCSYSCCGFHLRESDTYARMDMHHCMWVLDVLVLYDEKVYVRLHVKRDYDIRLRAGF